MLYKVDAMNGFSPTSLTTDEAGDKRRVLKMQNLRLTEWLEMVWHALKERDEMKRSSLLHAADRFLQNENQELEAAPRRGATQTTAA